MDYTAEDLLFKAMLPIEPVADFRDKGSGMPPMLPPETYRFFEKGEEYDSSRVLAFMHKFIAEFRANADKVQEFYIGRLHKQLVIGWEYDEYYADWIAIWEGWKTKRLTKINGHKDQIGQIMRQAALAGRPDVGQLIFETNEIRTEQDRLLIEHHQTQVEGLRESVIEWQWHINNAKAIRRLIAETKGFIEHFLPSTQPATDLPLIEPGTKKSRKKDNISLKQQMILLDMLEVLKSEVWRNVETLPKAKVLAQLLNRSEQEVRSMLTYWEGSNPPPDYDCTGANDIDLVTDLLLTNGLNI